MKSIFKSIGLVMILTVLSRFMALISQLYYLSEFGINRLVDIYSYALGLPNIIFAGIGTALTTVIVPVFAGYMQKGDRKRAFSFISNITTLSIIVTLALASIGILFAPIIIKLSTGFKSESDAYFAVFAIRCMFPVMIFYAITYIFQGVLQSQGRFVAPSLVSLPGCLLIILYVILLGHKYGVTGLLFATILGLSLQVIIMIPSMLNTGFNFKPSLNFKDHDLKNALKLVPAVFIGASAWQINMLVNSSMASYFNAGPTVINFVQNLIITGVLTFIYSITAVVFPKLSIYYSLGDTLEFKKLFVKSINTVLFFLIPFAFGIIVLGEEISNLLCKWGKISEGNIKMTANIMAFYAIGIIGHSVKEIADKAFYALRETKMPAINGVIIMVVNIVASFILIINFGVLGIPFAYSISLSVGAFVILFMLKSKIGSFDTAAIIKNIVKILFASIIMSCGILIINNLTYNIETGIIFANRLLLFIIPAFFGALIYFVFSLILKQSDASSIYKKIINRSAS